MKRLISLILAFVLIATMVPLGAVMAVAAEGTVGGTYGDNTTWELDLSTGALHIDGVGDMHSRYFSEDIPWKVYSDNIKTLTISDTVTSIDQEAFSGCLTLTEADLGKGVTKIGSCAFRDCVELVEIVIPDSVTSIESYAFDFCVSMEKVSIGNSVTEIGYGAFYQCDKLKTITIPDSVIYIDEYAFTNCTGLESVTLGNSITTIWEAAFSGCTALKEIRIPETVTYIGSGAFTQCSELVGIWVSEDNPQYSSDDRGVLFNKDKTVLLRAPGGMEGEYKIPDSVTEIYINGFYGCSELTGIEIPDGVSTIGEFAFSNCTALTEIELPERLEVLDWGQFAYCSALRSVVIPESVTEIKGEAFLYCSALREVTIPAGVTSVAMNAFIFCENLEKITFLNPECYIHVDEEFLDHIRNISMYAYRLSTAETVAKEYGIPFVPIIDCENGWHDPVETMIDEVTCTEDGRTSCVCTVCSATYIRTIPATGHDCWLSENCVGYNVWSCRNCSYSYHVDVSVPIPEGEIITENMGGGGFLRYYVFTPAYSEKHVITVDGQIMPFVALYDAERTRLATDNSDSWEKNQVSVSYELEAGKPYYIELGSNFIIGYQNMYIQVQIQHELTDRVISEGSCTEKEQVLRECDCGYSYVEVRDNVHEFVDQVCILCGLDTNVTINHTLNLAGDISASFVVKKELLEGYDLDTVYMESTLELYEGAKKRGTRVIRTEPVEKGNFYYFTFDGLTAVNMNDRLTSVLYGVKDGRPCYSPTDDYSVADYAYNQLNNPDVSRELKILCADLLRYGAKAQIYKGYRTDALADSAMTAVHKEYLTDSDSVEFYDNNRVLDDCTDDSVQWVGKALNLESKVNLRFVFDPKGYEGELSDLSLRVSYTAVNGETKTLTLEDAELYYSKLGYYSFTLDTLLASELRTVVSVQIYAGETPVSCTLQYSADTYGNNKTGDMLELCKALFAYSDSAKSFFTN